MVMKTSYKGVEVEISDEMPSSAMEGPDSEMEHMHEHEHHDQQAHNSGLKISGKQVHLISLSDGSFVSHQFPYVAGNSKLEVAQNLIDYVPGFGGKAYESDNQKG